LEDYAWREIEKNLKRAGIKVFRKIDELIKYIDTKK